MSSDQNAIQAAQQTVTGDQNAVKSAQDSENSTEDHDKGVLATKGSNGLTSADNTAAAPLTTVQDELAGFGTLNDVVVLAKSASQVTTVEGEITSILGLRHHETAADADFDVLSASTLLSTASSTAHTFTVLLGAVAAISLLVGGIGITDLTAVLTRRPRAKLPSLTLILAAIVVASAG